MTKTNEERGRKRRGRTNVKLGEGINDKVDDGRRDEKKPEKTKLLRIREKKKFSIGVSFVRKRRAKRAERSDIWKMERKTANHNKRHKKAKGRKKEDKAK